MHVSNSILKHFSLSIKTGENEDVQTEEKEKGWEGNVSWKV